MEDGGRRLSRSLGAQLADATANKKPDLKQAGKVVP